MTVSISATSRVRLYVPDVRAFDPASGEADVTTLPVQFALKADGVVPVELDWVAGAWLVGAPTPTAFILLSATGRGGALVAAAGEWALWLRVKGAVEQPEERVDTVVIGTVG